MIGTFIYEVSSRLIIEQINVNKLMLLRLGSI